MKLLFWLTQLLITVMLVITCAISSDMVSYPKSYPEHVHKTLFIDRNFNEAEIVYITLAAAEWNEKTGHIVDFEVALLPTSKEITLDNSIIFVKVGPDYPNILLLDQATTGYILGLYQDEPMPNIELVAARLGDRYFKSVVLHELGHALGLEHVKGVEGIGTLMYPSANLGADNITPDDLEHFCKLYKCDAKTLQKSN